MTVCPQQTTQLKQIINYNCVCLWPPAQPMWTVVKYPRTTTRFDPIADKKPPVSSLSQLCSACGYYVLAWSLEPNPNAIWRLNNLQWKLFAKYFWWSYNYIFLYIIFKDRNLVHLLVVKVTIHTNFASEFDSVQSSVVHPPFPVLHLGLEAYDGGAGGTRLAGHPVTNIAVAWLVHLPVVVPELQPIGGGIIAHQSSVQTCWRCSEYNIPIMYIDYGSFLRVM